MPKFKIGLRIIKTALSVFLCVIISHIIARESPVLSCLAAVYCLRSDASTSYNFGKHRLFGTFIGVLVSLGIIFIQNTVGRHMLIDALCAAIGVVCVILLCLHSKHPEGIVTSASTMLIICFNTPATETFGYAFARLIDVVIGATIALCVDYSLPANTQKK